MVYPPVTHGGSLPAKFLLAFVDRPFDLSKNNNQNDNTINTDQQTPLTSAKKPASEAVSAKETCGVHSLNTGNPINKTVASSNLGTAVPGKVGARSVDYQLRSIRKLRVWISEGLTQADS